MCRDLGIHRLKALHRDTRLNEDEFGGCGAHQGPEIEFDKVGTYAFAGLGGPSSNWPPEEKCRPIRRLDAMSNAASRSGKAIKCGQFNLELGPAAVGSIMDPGHFHCPKTSKAANSVWTCGHLGLVSTGLDVFGGDEMRTAPETLKCDLGLNVNRIRRPRAATNSACTSAAGLTEDSGTCARLVRNGLTESIELAAMRMRCAGRSLWRIRY